MARLKNVVIVTPVQLPDEFMPTIVGDRMLEGMCEGVVRYNQEAIRAGVLAADHPYSDKWGMVYARDPLTLGTLTIDGQQVQAREYWATAYGAAKRGKDDCETLSSWLVAWYREVCGINASCAIYPSIVAPGGIVGRHVVVWVPAARPIYEFAPYDADKFIRYVIPGKGYIEDPSVALGMYYVTDPRGEQPFPQRQPFILPNEVASRIAQREAVPYIPAHWINL